MSLTLRELIADPANGLSVVVAKPEHLDRALLESFITDLADPGRFLRPRAVVMTSGLWLRADDGVRTFFEALRQNEASALIMGLIEVGAVPDEVIAASRESDIPLLVTSDDILYSDLARRIEDAADPEGAVAVDAAVRYSREIASLVDAGDVIRHFHAAYGANCVLLGPGAIELSSVGSPGDVAALRRAWDQLERFREPSVRIAGVPGWTVHILDPGSIELGAFAVEVGEDVAAGLEIAVATTIAVLRTALLVAGLQDATRKAAASDFLNALLTGAGAGTVGELAARYRLAGGDPAEPMLAISARVEGTALLPVACLSLLEHVFAPTSSTISRIDDDGVTILVPLGGRAIEPLVETARAALVDFADVIGTRTLRIGVSDPVAGALALRGAVTQAASRREGVRGAGILIGASPRAESHRSLLAVVSPDLRQRFALNLLAPVISHDGRTNVGLIESLRVFLRHLGRWQDAASELHVHPNTLRYRMGRIEALTGRSLSNISDWLDLQVALDELDAADRQSRET